MSYLRPCARCHKDGRCPIQRGMRERIRELNREYREARFGYVDRPRITSVLFTCPARWRGMTPGCRVLVTFRWVESFASDEGHLVNYPEAYGEETHTEKIGGWVLGNNVGDPPGKLEIWLDRETTMKGKRRVRLWPMNTPAVSISPLPETCDVKKMRRQMEHAAAAHEGREWEDWECGREDNAP